MRVLIAALFARIAELNAQHVAAESFAREVCPDRLQRLDAEVAAAAERARQEREQVKAQHAAAEAEVRKRSEAMAAERMRARQKQQDDAAALQTA